MALWTYNWYIKHGNKRTLICTYIQACMALNGFRSYLSTRGSIYKEWWWVVRFLRTVIGRAPGLHPPFKMINTNDSQVEQVPNPEELGNSKIYSKTTWYLVYAIDTPWDICFIIEFIDHVCYMWMTLLTKFYTTWTCLWKEMRTGKKIIQPSRMTKLSFKFLFFSFLIYRIYVCQVMRK